MQLNFLHPLVTKSIHQITAGNGNVIISSTSFGWKTDKPWQKIWVYICLAFISFQLNIYFYNFQLVISSSFVNALQKIWQRLLWLKSPLGKTCMVETFLKKQDTFAKQMLPGSSISGSSQSLRVKATRSMLMSSEKAWPMEYTYKIWTLYLL